MLLMIANDTRIAAISSAIRVIPDFPKPGILFHDITTLLLDTKAFLRILLICLLRDTETKISLLLQVISYFIPIAFCIEARGFIFGPPIALAIGAKFVPMRKPKKLPGIFLNLSLLSFDWLYNFLDFEDFFISKYFLINHRIKTIHMLKIFSAT
ncbi:hypothetical protein JRO89_XS09G0155100 [Xanthoceras sorbifolium]|uniref:adenine phosphoribosyltransferase n=1 Tax=Xanthoceras sorbifolium TaxID=99658 RepID=A0ABQ8HLP3_9ROSI|nr:hypothetical protein JRO89_XS09G0155100 [Xanthoceras sorbifolium]